MVSEDSSSDVCGCGHPRANHHWHAARGEACIGNRNLCSCRLFRFGEEEPPVTPEEEEEACETGDMRTCTTACPVHGVPEEADPPPPQPARRPPYAVTYSVSGHLYEVALPGDATVKAVDGALVIQHHLGPVAGIVQVLPVINEGSADGAE